jgi:hypothetical protein
VGEAVTDLELSQFIKTLFFTYDRALVPKDLKEYCSAWSPYIKEFDYSLCQQLLPNICMGREFIPRPWEVRVALINHTKSITPPPSPQQAWAQYQEIMAAVTSGASADIQTHDVLVEVMRALGSAGMNNQFDAKRFEALYVDKTNQWMKKTYWVGS